jgi:hypothetical protein
MIYATAKPYTELTAAEETAWYNANNHLIEWDETPEQAYNRLNAPKKVTVETKKYFQSKQVRLATINESGYTLKPEGLTFWVTDI